MDEPNLVGTSHIGVLVLRVPFVLSLSKHEWNRGRIRSLDCPTKAMQLYLDS